MKSVTKNPGPFFLNEINAVIKFLIVSDVMVIGATAMFTPLFALFVENSIVNGNALVVGAAMSIFLFSRSIFQIPIATIIDKIRGEKDDYLLLVLFSFISAALMLLYLVISQPWQLYVVQLLLGLATALTFPSYMAIFTRHVDTNKEGTEWGIYFTFTDLGSAGLAILGGYLVTTFGFSALIWTTSGLSALGAILLLPIKKYLKL